MEMSHRMSRREFAGAARRRGDGAGVSDARLRASRGRVVVVGGGFAGATARAR